MQDGDRKLQKEVQRIEIVAYWSDGSVRRSDKTPETISDGEAAFGVKKRMDIESA